MKKGRKALGVIGVIGAALAGGLAPNLSEKGHDVLVVNQNVEKGETNKKGTGLPVQSPQAKFDLRMNPFGGYGSFLPVSTPSSPMYFPKRQKLKGWQKQSGVTSSYRRKKCVKGGRK